MTPLREAPGRPKLPELGGSKGVPLHGCYIQVVQIEHGREAEIDATRTQLAGQHKTR
jgi:hypothetical protein